MSITRLFDRAKKRSQVRAATRLRSRSHGKDNFQQSQSVAAGWQCHTATSKKLDAAHVVRIAPVYRALQTRSPEANLALYVNRDVNMVLFLRRWRAQVHFRMSSDGCRLQVADIVPPGVDDKRPEFATIDEASAYIDRMMSL